MAGSKHNNCQIITRPGQCNKTKPCQAILGNIILEGPIRKLHCSKKKKKEEAITLFKTRIKINYLFTPLTCALMSRDARN